MSHRNLVSDSALLSEIVELVRAGGGRLSASAVAAEILKLPGLDAHLAGLLVGDIVGDDPRLSFEGDETLRLTLPDGEARPLSETEFVVVDVETTGARTPPNRITEIGAYRVAGGRIVAEFQTLVNPCAAIPPFISALTGITDQMVAGAPRFADVADNWLRFAGDAVLVAHNAPFDVRFLNHELARVYPGRRMSNAHLCTVSLARRALPRLDNHRLHTVAEHFRVQITARHRAAGDARATAEILLRLLAHLDQDGVTSLAQARKYKARVEGRGPERGPEGTED